jgi:hypothetical protein
MGKMRSASKISSANPDGKRPLGRHRRRWETIIKVFLKEIACEDVDWIHDSSGGLL